MSHCKEGFAHTVVFVLVIIVGFVAALGYPQYKKHQEISSAQEALSSARLLADAQRAYAKEHKGAYAKDWLDFNLPLTCPQITKEGVSVLECARYTFFVQDGVVMAKHNKFPKWFTVNIATGQADCSHEPDSVVGAHLCANTKL